MSTDVAAAPTVPGVGNDVENEEVPDEEFEALLSAVHAAECTRRSGTFSVALSIAPGSKPLFSARGRPGLPSDLVRALGPLVAGSVGASGGASWAGEALLFALERYEEVVKIVRRFAPADAVSEIPGELREVVREHFERARVEAVGLSKMVVREMVGRTFWGKLFEFQQEGVLQAVRKGGRVILADEMGMGKTVSALAIAEYYRATEIAAGGEDCASDDATREAPVLILCPSTLRATWVAAVSHWLPNVPATAVHSISSAKDAKRLLNARARGQRDVWDKKLDVRFVICSYDLLPRLLDLATPVDGVAGRDLRDSPPVVAPVASGSQGQECDADDEGLLEWKSRELPPELACFRIVIADECHSLKNVSTARARACIPIILGSDFRILVSGTPVMSKPAELFAQLQCVFGTGPTFGSFVAPDLFEERYCGGSSLRGRGATNTLELNALLSLVMVRRSKEDVQLQLPPKIRTHCLLDLPEDRLQPVRRKLNHLDELSASLFEARNANAPRDDIAALEKKLGWARIGLFAATGQAKIPGILARIRTLLVGPTLLSQKMLFFAHHRSVLDAVEEFCRREKLRYIRMDGSTQTSVRGELVNLFQTDSTIRIAILSISTAGTGLTMTAASHVVFGELDWVPATLVQAEDRAHRIGRVGAVFVDYIVAEGTLDERMWPAVRRKLGLVGELVDGTNRGAAVLDPERASEVSWVAMRATSIAAGAGTAVLSCDVVEKSQSQIVDPNTTPSRSVLVNASSTPGKRIRLSP